MASKARQIALQSEFSKSDFDLMENLLCAIEKWNGVTSKELARRLSCLEEKRHVEEYDWDALADESYMLDKTKRVMYGTIAVALFAALEKFLFGLCVCSELLKVEIETKDGTEKRTITNRNGDNLTKPNWGNYQQLIQTGMNLQFGKFLCFDSIQRVRRLNNCFKHSDGSVDADFANSYGGTIGDDIPYESEKWQELIENCKSFMLQLAKKAQKCVC